MLWVLAAFFLALGGLFYWADRILRPTILKIAEAQAVHMATEAINQAVRQEIKESNLQYDDLVRLHKDSQGHIVLMQADTVKINGFMAEVTLDVQRALQELAQKTFRIPLGQVTGSQLLANYGPRISVTVIPVGTVRVGVDDRFEQAGINQTRHRIYLDLSAEVRIVVPPQSTVALVTEKVPLVESIIVGQVPGTFVQFPPLFKESP
ncbi:sporulation protein YunB [Desulfovirgula thermocuniculi]|uniref:sporulation protein YunB n=1 Tax=Desulfovirgula thermocuniculi TaxID=348842 RepID=UPI000409287B|nr:sporulation protein YunB [Desulfovirgula thermocuniculi]